MEHVSKEEGTPKEGYLTKETAREAALTMQYKYGESFAVYKCQQCGFFHIGRNRRDLMENEQATLETKEEKEINRPHYRLICSNTGVGFLNLLNENYEDGYKLDRDTLQFREHLDKETGVKVIRREAYLYDSEDTGINGEEKGKRLEIIDTIDKAETYLYGKKSLLEDRENYLTLNTPWDVINNARKSKELPKISNEKQRTAYLNKDEQLKTLKVEVQEAEQYLKLVKKYAELHELPSCIAPWYLEEEKARAQDEIVSKQAVPEKVGAPDPKEAQEAE